MMWVFEELAKMDPVLASALRNIRVGKGSPGDAAVVARSLYTDTMVPRLGNKMAYNEFLQRHGNDGYHVHLDLNDFGQINKLHGEAMGDEAIKRAGNIISEVSRTFGGKAFRNGGDEFKTWFHKPEAAHGFARELRARLERQPKIGGTHNLAASIGIGFNRDHAEGALLEAKKKLGPTVNGKRENRHAVGAAPTVIHSRTHEPIPDGWRSPSGSAPQSMPNLAPTGMKFHNPLVKDEAGVLNHPHADGAIPKQPTGYVNEQAAGKGVATYAKFANAYGKIKPGAKSNLMHYDYRPHEEGINRLLKQHGYKVYFAGGKYGKPDLANKNYNTGHLMIYDPTPSSGGDFQDESYTRTWRTVHELAHALTYPHLNAKYGEGRRMGKLGVHRTPREAKRSVEWEWLTAHKQRELTEQLTGKRVPDHVFNRELNTVMHDALHRAVTGKFTEPSEEGFEPHHHAIPLEHALGMIDAEAKKMGLKHDDDLLPKKL